MENIFWEKTYSKDEVSTFGKPSGEVVEVEGMLKRNSKILDMGCGDGKTDNYINKKDNDITAPLIIIDMQKAFLNRSWGKRNNPNMEENIIKLINNWRKINQPIIFVRHESENEESRFYINSVGHEFMDKIFPINDEIVIGKKVNSAFIGTNLEEILNNMESSKVVIVGLTTNHCVETTTRMAGNLGLNPILVSDACATFERKGVDGQVYSPELIHEMTLTNLNDEFAEILNTEEVLKYL